MLVSIIIPAYNAEATLQQCLEACLKQSYQDIEVIVVDDGSTDSTAAIAKGMAGIRYVYQPNSGPAAARNRGAREAKGALLAYTDSDCVPREDWIEKLVAPFTGGEEIVAVGGTYDIANKQSRLACMIHEEIDARHRQFKGEVDFLGSFNVAYQREAFEAVQGFDESYRYASGEDNDLAYRLQDAGGRLRFTAAAVVAHHHPTRLGPYLKTQARHGYWRMKLYRQHPTRMQGDQYAGFLDLIAPPLALVLIGLLPCCGALFLVWGNPWIVAGYLLLLLLYYLLHLPMAVRLLPRLGIIDTALFAAITSLRDVARAFGLVAGAVQFYRVRPPDR